jgi:dolichol kinase
MNLANELYRKSLHFLLILIPIFYVNLGKWKTLLIIAPLTAVVVFLDYYRRENPKIQNLFVKIFGAILRPHEIESKKLCGASNVGISACINFFLFEPKIAVTSFLILVISDGLAAIVGKSIPSRPFYEKSLAGALTFFITALAILIGCGMYYHVQWWFYFFGIFSVACVTMLESRPSLIDLDDNFSIPMVFSLLMVGFGFMWG